MRCKWCGEELQFVRGRGWRHAQGGLYMMRCGRCGWRGALEPSPVACPKCGAVRELKDDHCAMPVAGGANGGRYGDL